MVNILIGLGAGFGVGSGISWLINTLLKKQKIHQTKQEAQHIIQKVKDTEEYNRELILNKVEEYKLSLVQKQEKEVEILSKAHRKLQMDIEQITQQTEEELGKLEKFKMKHTTEAKVVLKVNEKKANELKQIKNHLKETQKQIIQILTDKFQINVENLKSHTKNMEIEHAKTQMFQQIKEQEEDFKHNINQSAYFILELALNRFQHPYCSERGIKNVNFRSQNDIDNLLGPDFSKLRILEKECGVDMKVSDNDTTVNILGIDPVRKELGRASLQRMFRRKPLKENEIKKLVKDTKKNLFRQIKNDGEKICHVLNLKNVKTEVKNMMGALRYRYSFAQNQYFHCQEVGWLCGLLNAELGEPLFPARRAGMLHDIGKAMDHSKEGGHAVIGADFIETHGEDVSVVHAVKAHHYDVTPHQPLDFLVIAADALSGARPGARRSTEDSYNQKVLTLEKIGRSFTGVKDTYIMSAGREIRVIVDSTKINDVKALELSKKIARKIEEECSYPGLIKVTVVRTVTKTVNNNRGFNNRGFNKTSF